MKNKKDSNFAYRFNGGLAVGCSFGIYLAFIIWVFPVFGVITKVLGVAITIFPILILDNKNLAEFLFGLGLGVLIGPEIGYFLGVLFGFI